MPLQNIGMVTAADFADINKDGWPDLVVAGEWMPLIIYLNKNGTFQKKELPNSTGWWQAVIVDDVNGDGNVDILAWQLGMEQ